MSSKGKLKGKDCKILEQLVDLSKKGYDIPWIKKEGISPFQELVLKELIKKPTAPGSICCLDELEEQYRIDHDKIKVAAAEVLEKGEFMQPHNFWKVTMRALEKDIMRYVDNDTNWARKLLVCYAAYALKDHSCHAESVNDLLTLTYEAEESFPDDPSLQIIHLLEVIRAWKSGLICGVVEECFKMQERFIGRVKPACSKFVETLDKMSSVYSNLKEVMGELSSSDDGDLEGAVGELQAICDDLYEAIGMIAPIYNEIDDLEKSA